MTVVPLREYPTFGRVATWDEWLAATAQSIPDGNLFPWFISNMLGFVLLWTAILQQQQRQRRPSSPALFARQAWGFLLMLASVVNAYQMMTDPTGYHEFGVLAIPPMQPFIYSKYFIWLVHLVAASQMVIGAVLLFLPRTRSETTTTTATPPDTRHRNDLLYVKAALTGAIAFFIGLAPLGMASAFPSSLIYASTMMLCWPTNIVVNKKKQHEE